MRDNNENKNREDWKCVSERKDRNSGALKVLGLMALSLVIVVGGIFAGMKGYDYLENNKATASEKETVEQETTEQSETVDDVAVKTDTEVAVNLEEVYKYIHRMSNTIIIPVDGKIMGQEEITKASIEKALNDTQSQDSYLYDEIKKWEAGDFNNAVDIHNYVWKKLDGNIGKAGSLNNDEIEKVKVNL